MRLAMLSHFQHDYGRCIARTFETLGNEVQLYDLHARNQGVEGFFRYSIMGRMGYDALKRDRKKFIKEVKNNIFHFKPDAILVIRGVGEDFFSEIIKDYLGRSSGRPKIAIWQLDDIRKVKGGIGDPFLFDDWFLIEPQNVPLMKKEWGVDAHFLATGYDSNEYRVLRDIDFSESIRAEMSFVGGIDYPIRLKVLEHLSIMAEKEGIEFVIVNNSFRFPRLKLRKYPHLLKNLFKGSCNHQRNNMLYNYCKINLNIHNEYSFDTVNSRFFEILGSGGLQIVEPKSAQKLLGFEPDRDFLSYSNLDELDEKIKYVFDHPVEGAKIAQSGHEKSKHHDFHARARYILKCAFP